MPEREVEDGSLVTGDELRERVAIAALIANHQHFVRRVAARCRHAEILSGGQSATQRPALARSVGLSCANGLGLPDGPALASIYSHAIRERQNGSAPSDRAATRVAWRSRMRPWTSP